MSKIETVIVDVGDDVVRVGDLIEMLSKADPNAVVVLNTMGEDRYGTISKSVNNGVFAKGHAFLSRFDSVYKTESGLERRCKSPYIEVHFSEPDDWMSQMDANHYEEAGRQGKLEPAILI